MEKGLWYLCQRSILWYLPHTECQHLHFYLKPAKLSMFIMAFWFCNNSVLTSFVNIFHATRNKKFPCLAFRPSSDSFLSYFLLPFKPASYFYVLLKILLYPTFFFLHFFLDLKAMNKQKKNNFKMIQKV